MNAVSVCQGHLLADQAGRILHHSGCSVASQHKRVDRFSLLEHTTIITRCQCNNCVDKKVKQNVAQASVIK